MFHTDSLKYCTWTEHLCFNASSGNSMLAYISTVSLLDSLRLERSFYVLCETSKQTTFGNRSVLFTNVRQPFQMVCVRYFHRSRIHSHLKYFFFNGSLLFIFPGFSQIYLVHNAEKRKNMKLFQSTMYSYLGCVF